MCDDANLKKRLNEFRARLDKLRECGASEEDIYKANVELDDYVNEYMKKYSQGDT